MRPSPDTDTPQRHRGSPLAPDDRARLAQAVHDRGQRVVLAAACTGRHALAAAMAGLPIMEGTRALVLRGLARLDAEAVREAQAARLAGESGGRR